MIDSGTLLQERFLVEEKIGVGGMGAVYRGVDQKFGSTVAIKETFYGDTELGEAFEREARLLNGLHHPILPHVSDYFTENGGHFLVMEFIEGEDLSALLKRGETFTVSTVMGWTLDILDGLDYLHSQNPPIIHRDIKPNNLKLTSRGRIVLLDFGMAKETSHNTLGAKSVFGYSRRYSPLEQIEGTGTDVRSDLFSLGATVYHLLTGNPPVDVLARASAIVAGRPDPLLPVNSINTDVPESVSAIVNSALSLNADNRFESARAMSNALDFAIGTNPIAQKPENEHVVAFAASEVDARAEEAAAFEAVGGPEVFDDQTEPVIGDNANPAAQPLQDFWRSEDESEREAVDTTPLVTDGSSRTVVAVAGAAGSASLAGSQTGVRSHSQSKRTTRKSGRPGYVYWVPALLLCLGLALFGAYRAARMDDGTTTVSNEPAAGVSTEPIPGGNAETVSGSTSPNGVAVPESEEDRSAEPSAEIADSQFDDSTLPEEDDAPVRTENPINLKKGPIIARRESPARVVPETKPEPRNVTAPEPAPKRPTVARSPVKQASTDLSRRAVRPAFEQPHVSSIEAIFSGVPYEQRRRWESDRDPGFEEEMRRRRMRQIRRENRRRQLPF